MKQKEYFLRRGILLLAMGLLAIALDKNPVYAEDASLIRVPVVETSDIHGFLVDVSSGDPSSYQYRMAYISNIVNELREQSDVLLLDGGDIYQGNAISNLSYGKSMIAAYDLMEYDAVALGNHEFDWSVTDLIDADGTMGSYDYGEGLSHDSQIPVLAENVYYKDTKEHVSFAQDYIILEKTGRSADGQEKKVKIAVFGYEEDYSSSIMAAKIAPYVIEEDDLSDIEAEAGKLEASGQADATILLSHALASSVANCLSEDTVIDLVCGGHTHWNETGKTENQVTYIQPAAQGQYYAYAELCFDTEGQVHVENIATPQVTADRAKLYDTEENLSADSRTLDPDLVNLSKLAIEQVAPIMDEKVGTQTASINSSAIKGQKYTSTAATWMCDMYNLATGSQVSFINAYGIRTNLNIPTGETSRTLTVGDIYTIAPFGNTLPSFTVTYEKLKELLESIPDCGLNLRMGGATAYYDETTKEVTTFFVGDSLCYENGVWKVDKDATVVVATNEYVATASGSPFYELTADDKPPVIDNESMIEILRTEAANHSGQLFVNTDPTFICGSWDGQTIPKVHRIDADSDEDAETESKTLAKVSLSTTTYTYNGKAKKPKVTAYDQNGSVIPSSSYTVTYKNNTSAGTAQVIVKCRGDYSGSLKKSFTIQKAAQKITVNISKKTLKAKKLKRKKQTLKITVKNAKGKVSFKSKNKKHVKVSSKGRVTVKKRTGKGKYKIVVSVAATKNYKSAKKTITIKVK